MEIKEPWVDIGLHKESAIPRIFVVIVVVGLWGKDNEKFALFKWILPFLRSDNITNYALWIENLVGIVFVRGMSQTYRIWIDKN